MFNNIETKKKILEEIENHAERFERKSDIQYRIRCPFCGDSSNPNDAHMYIKCDLNNPYEPILYNCFKGNCGARGIVNDYFMKKIGCKSKFINDLDSSIYNKIPSYKEANVEIITGEVDMKAPQVKYIEDRLGKGFNKEDFERMKIIWNWENIIPYINSKKILNTLPNNSDSISFLSDNKSIILNRAFDNEGGWRKIPIIKAESISCYTMKSVFNLFTSDMIYVNIAEGIFDILSIYKNFNDGENSVFLATLGSDYINGINYIIGKGIVGYNVVVKIYIDSDIEYNILKKKLKTFKYYFNKIIIYINTKSKDVGVKLEDIDLIEKII